MKRYIFILTGCLWLTTSCSDFLELNESQYHTVEYQFSTFENVKQVATNVYGYVQDGLADVGNTMRDAATDDAVYAWESNNLKTYYDGSWSSTNLIDNQWSHYYSAISAANYFLENCPSDFPATIYQENYKEKVQQLKNYPLEIKALRAYFHFELLKRYRNIILVDHSLSIDEVNNLKPTPFDQAVSWIVDQCDEVIPLLPVTYENTTKGEIARTTKGMAMALKARILLYAASPLNNPTDDKTKWLKAAEAAKHIIDANIYRPVNEEVVNNAAAAGLIFGKWNSPNNNFEAANFPIGFEGGYSGVCPSQNLAEAFDLIDGTPFDWNNEEHRKSALKVENRDPRFQKTLLPNGVSFKGEIIESFLNGKNGLPKEGATPTSYYLRKLLKEETSLIPGSTTSYQHIVPLFRYEEVLLNYAEALLEAEKNPTYKGKQGEVDYQLSPLEAVNQVRKRVGMPRLPDNLDYLSFQKRLRNERRVELAFEGHRFWDIRRWKMGKDTKKVYGLTLTAKGDGTLNVQRTLVHDRIWEDKMYYYPIADFELFNNKNLTQNDGWK
ncbi:RagB/SusD family nutrient uptake outer membrane protein [Bacteroides sp.]|uniref:RagB/SusD family nutrient uptake outer membrane protein n=1 Tax=Bacteroides sp. TaxID=29523 RepID=UPI00260BA182|nr:RagB/SusD family nutrient uptake outer membrane protein [Bacteroides sp.]MDD3039214.1 RagB/SusD family nutrient uptake outer membrane protein [Bacteroides sp.]